MDTTQRDDFARAVAADYGNRPDALLEILHRVQEECGFVSESVVRTLAEALNLSRAEVHGVVTFYHDFRLEPHGEHVLKICRAEACQARGVDALVASTERRLGVSCGETTNDGKVTFEPIFCLGLCATGPSAMLDGKIVARATATKIDQMLKGVGA